jgi:hypothetical protein
MAWEPGSWIVRRDVWRGRPLLGVPVLVVSDTPELLALYLPESAPFGFAEGAFPTSPHPWSAHAGWQGHGVLMVQRPGDAYAVWVFWAGRQRRFDCWYVNFQDPFRRTPSGIDTHDHELDLWSRDGRTWHWKDAELLDQRVAEGWFTPEEATAIRAEGRRVHAELTTAGTWWDQRWNSWTSPPYAAPRALPQGWADEPAADA